MQVAELRQRLKRLSTDKLIDVVKNYRQYGYDEDVRNYALSLLEEQGISQNDLLLTGNLENKSYDYANDLLTSFKKNSKMAFLFYGLLIILNITNAWLAPVSISTALKVGLILAIILYFVFLLRSFLNQSDFYKSTGEEFGSDGALTYLFLGMPFYIIMYFVFQSQMKERMKMVH